MAFRSRRLKPCEIANSWEDIGWDVVQLIRDLSYCNSKFVKNGTRISIENLYECYDQITRNGGVGCELEDSQWKKVCEFRQTISLKSARRIAFRMGLTLHELLNGERYRAPQIFCTTNAFTISYHQVLMLTLR